MPCGRDQKEKEKKEQEGKRKEEKILSQKLLRDKRQQSRLRTMANGRDATLETPPTTAKNSTPTTAGPGISATSGSPTTSVTGAESHMHSISRPYTFQGGNTGGPHQSFDSDIGFHGFPSQQGYRPPNSHPSNQILYHSFQQNIPNPSRTLISPSNT